MRRKSAFDFIYIISAKVRIVTVKARSIIFGWDQPKHIFLQGSITLHELSSEMSSAKAKYTKRISIKKRINVNVSGSVPVFS